MGVIVTRPRGAVRVAVQGVADVRVVGAVREALAHGLEEGRRAVLDLSAAASADAAFAQLTVSARHSFDARGISLDVTGAEILATALPGSTAAPDVEPKGDPDAG